MEYKHKWKFSEGGGYWTEEVCEHCGLKWVSQIEDFKHYPEGGLHPIYGCNKPKVSNAVYIKPRKKLPVETKEYELLRRTEENIEFYYACGRMSHVSYLEEIVEYLENIVNFEENI